MSQWNVPEKGEVVKQSQKVQANSSSNKDKNQNRINKAKNFRQFQVQIKKKSQ